MLNTGKTGGGNGGNPPSNLAFPSPNCVPGSSALLLFQAFGYVSGNLVTASHPPTPFHPLTTPATAPRFCAPLWLPQ